MPLAVLFVAVQLMTSATPAPLPDRPAPARAATARVISDDADRFADLFTRTGGRPTAEQLQAEYLDRGSYGVRVVMAPRIGSAARMARAVATRTEAYRRAIADCLPAARAATGDLRAIYARFATLFPDKRLPQVYLTFGSDTTGGTADAAALVIGMETFCASALATGDPRATLKAFLAHETVHALQDGLDRTVYERSPLLATALMEGAADLLALEVTGVQPVPDRHAWATSRRRELMTQFRADVAATENWPIATAPRTDPNWRAMRRWVWNYGQPPAGWPVEAGYWVGQDLWTAWLSGQPDRGKALRELILIREPEAILTYLAPEGDLAARAFERAPVLPAVRGPVGGQQHHLAPPRP